MQKAPPFESIFEKIKSLIQNSLPSRAWDWQAVFLVIALVQIASARLVISEWAPNLTVIQSISLYAVILGLLLGYCNFTGKISAWISIEYALLIIPLQLLASLDKTERTKVYMDDLKNLLLRLFDSSYLFFKNLPIYDTVFFVMLASAVFWLIGCYVGYRLTRHNSFLDSIIGPGLIILIVQIYDPWVSIRIWGLAVFIFTALALLGRMNYLENKKRWKHDLVFVSYDTEWKFSRSILYSAGLAVFIVWALPGAMSSIKPISKAWRNFANPFFDRFSNSVTALESPYGPSPSGDFYGSELALGINAPVSNIPVLFIEVPQNHSEIVRYYWRGRIYDMYQDGQWVNKNSQRTAYDPDFNELDLWDISTRTNVELKVTINFQKQDLLYAPADVTWVNREGELIVAPMENGKQEVLGIVARPGLIAGSSYQVETMIATPTIQDLQNAGTQYPTWISQRYLQVPEKIKPQLKELAGKITAESTNPYDKAQAVTNYLRRNIQYQTSIDKTPPSGIDPVLWVLFDYKKGFCMYYASAEVLMLRTLGIPARIAVGFAEGTFDEQRDRYTVARLDAHAWPEVYFPGIGWIEFEPTVNQQPLNRPQERKDNTNTANTTPSIKEPLANIDEGIEPTPEIESNSPDAVGTETSQNLDLLIKILPYILLIPFIISIFFLSKRYAIVDRFPVYLAERYSKNGAPPPNWIASWAYWAQLMPIEKYYQTINRCLRLLGIKHSTHSTPSERANALSRVLPAAARDIQILSMEYQDAVFAAQPVHLTKARRASHKILYKTWLARIFHYKEIVKRRYN